MITRQHLVEEWKANLAAGAQADEDVERRFAWVRQIYERIYRFLVSCYGEGQWRGTGDDSIARADLASNTSRMPFVDHRPTTDGLAPKSRERIRAALDSIHRRNPGIATTGAMSGIENDSWVVVAAQKKPHVASSVQRRLVACGLDARLQDRTTDMAVIVRYVDFPRALAVVQDVGRGRQIRFSTSARVDPVTAVGVFLLFSSVLTFLALLLLDDPARPALSLVGWALWIAGLAAGWLYVRGRRLR